MQHVQLPKEDVDAWKAQTTLDYDEETDNTPVPLFHLKKKDFAFGNGNLRVATVLLQVNCAVADARYLKTLMSDAFLHDYMDRGTFLPSGLHLITDTATLKQKLSDHNEFLEKTENIPVVGLPPTAFSIPAATNLERFIHESRLFSTVESTSASERLGKHFFITTKDKSEAAKQWIDSELTEWAQEFIYPELRTPTFDHPRRTVLGSLSSSIATYASRLQLETAETEDGDYNRKAPAVHRKKRRQAITLTFDETEYPALPGATKASAQPKKNSEVSEITTTATISQTQATEMRKTLAIAEEKWAREMKAMQESFTKRNQTFATTMKEQLESQQNAFESQIQAQQEATEKLCNQVASIHSEMGELKTMLTEVKTALTNKNDAQKQYQRYQSVEDWNAVPQDQVQHYVDAALARARQGTHEADGYGVRQVTPTQLNGQGQHQQPPSTPPGRIPQPNTTPTQMGGYSPQYFVPPAHYPPNTSYPYENGQQANTHQLAGSPNHQNNMEGTPQRGGN
jgi:hypothetical protein